MLKDYITSEKSSPRCFRFRCSSGKYEWGWKANHFSKGKIGQKYTSDNDFIETPDWNNDLDNSIVYGIMDHAENRS